MKPVKAWAGTEKLKIWDDKIKKTRDGRFIIYDEDKEKFPGGRLRPVIITQTPELTENEREILKAASMMKNPFMKKLNAITCKLMAALGMEKI